MIFKCTKNDERGAIGKNASREYGEVVSAQFYALETDTKGNMTGSRTRVDADAPVDFAKVAAEFAGKGVHVEIADLKAAYDA